MKTETESVYLANTISRGYKGYSYTIKCYTYTCGGRYKAEVWLGEELIGSPELTSPHEALEFAIRYLEEDADSRGPKFSIGGYSYSFEEAQETNQGWVIQGWAISLMLDGACVNRLYAPTKREAQVKAFNWLLDLHEAKDKTFIGG